MIKALDIATQGMLSAERRATDLAAEILKSAGDAASFTLETDTGVANAAAVSASGRPTAVSNASSGGGYGDLLQQMVDLKAEEQSFKANAKVFQRVNDMLGTLLDDKG